MIKKINVKDVKNLLPRRKPTENKTHGGRSLIVAGSDGMLGAGVLVAQAAARVGSGYVILMTDLKKFSQIKNPDFLTVDYKKQKISKQNFSSLAVGPGLGQSSFAKKILSQVLKLKVPHVIFDADALNILATQKRFSLKESWIITPHEGELSRLLGLSSRKIKNDRPKYAKLASKKFHCIVVLKGPKTLVASHEKLFEIQTGNAALAKAGTGDVLTGMIAGFLAQGVKPLDAALLATTLHGKIANDWIKTKDHLSLMASDLVQKIPETILKIRG